MGRKDQGVMETFPHTYAMQSNLRLWYPSAPSPRRSRGVVKMLASFEDTELIHLVFEACMGGDLYKLLSRQQGELTEDYVCMQVR